MVAMPERSATVQARPFTNVDKGAEPPKARRTVPGGATGVRAGTTGADPIGSALLAQYRAGVQEPAPIARQRRTSHMR
ncbi:hypothetical protein GCM10009782_42860 [Glycomyces algeriensis]